MHQGSLPKRKQQFNVFRKPLFPCHIVTDNLHLFLQVSDILIDLLIQDLLRLNSLGKAKKIAGLDQSKHRHIAAFEDFV